MPEPFDAFTEKNLELYEWFKEFHPQWWKQVDALHLIGITINRENLSEHFPVRNMQQHEWNDLWNILVTRQCSQIY